MKQSAGLLMYRRRTGADVEVLLVHPGGPFWARRDLGAWSLPKGEFVDGEDPLGVAKREFREETGFSIDGAFHPLTPLQQPGGKLIHAWAIEGDCDPAQISSNVFSLEWPPRSGQIQQFPEIDRAAWFPLDEARRRLLPGQVGFIDQLSARSTRQSIPNFAR